ncbi:MAG: glycosyltransferase family 2 protein [Candidatus Dormibacteria bacterium]
MSFFFPAYNEAGNVTPMVEAALKVLPAFAGEIEVIIVDDGSRDGTEDEGRRLAAQHPSVRYVRHDVNRGYGEALRTGLRTASGDVVFWTDGDQQFDLRELDRMWPLLNDNDVVAGYRIRRADPFHRLFIAWTYNRVLRVMFGLRTRDVDCAFKVVKKEVADSVVPLSGGAFFSAEFLLRARQAGYRVAEVGVNHFPRTVGSAKGATPAVILRTFREMFALWASFRRAGRRLGA